MNTAEIEGIQLADIMVEKSAIQELRKGSGEKEVCILKHEYLISYQGQLMGTIVVYGIE